MVFAHRIGHLSDSFPNLPIGRGQSVACLPNLKKTADMAPGQVSFHDQRKVYRTTVASRKNAIARAWRVRSRGKEGGVGSFRQAQSGRCTSGVQTHTSPAVLPRHTNHLKSRKSYEKCKLKGRCNVPFFGKRSVMPYPICHTPHPVSRIPYSYPHIVPRLKHSPLLSMGPHRGKNQLSLVVQGRRI